jgi:cell division transport system permease protein
MYSFFSSLGSLYKHRLGTLMTVLVLGIAMFLPLSLYVTLENLKQIDLQYKNWGAITVFLSVSADQADAESFSMQVNERADASAVIISPEQGLEEFRDSSGFGQALEVFDANPLPWVLHITPDPGETGSLEDTVERLSGWLEQQEPVDAIQLDYKWLQRLAGLTELGATVASLVTLMFSLAVVVVVSNTIRLDVAARAEEIQVLSLVGAGNSFIRQPFLYSGFWYGVLGALLALMMLNLSLGYIAGPMQRLLESYGNDFELTNLGVRQILALMLMGGMFGLFGAWVSVQRHLGSLRSGLGY